MKTCGRMEKRRTYLFLSDNAGLVVCVNRGLALGCPIFLGIRHVEVDPRFPVYKRG
jgi:hypothetical protein